MGNRLFAGLLLLLSALLVWGGYWFTQNFERHSEEIRSGFSTQARRNPLLAAERYLQRLGLDVESLSGRQYLSSPPAKPGVLLVKDLGPSLPLEREARLLAWAESGGHLIASVGRLPATDEPGNHLLETLGISLVELNPDESESPPLELVMPGGQQAIRVGFDRSRGLRYEGEDAHWQVPATEGYHLLNFPWGRGAITLLSDNRFLNNSRIDEHDHALFLARLVSGEGRAWLLYSSQMPSLSTLLWRNAPYLVISGGVLVLVLLWWLTYRSGPVLDQVNPQRRDLLEHLQAASEFVWGQDRSQALRQRTREQVERLWLQRHPRLGRMERSARIEWLAARTGLKSQAVQEGVYGEDNEAWMLIETSATLQRLLAVLHKST
ncbi:MAG: DUF4350 domain-containing protein [Pseudomonadota bacterium]